MAQTRLLSQISALHQTISNLKNENRRLEQRNNASRAYARTVEDSTFITTHTTTNLFDRNSTTTTTSTFPRISSESRILAQTTPLPPSSSVASSAAASTSFATASSAAASTTTSTMNNNDTTMIEQLERDNLFYMSRVQELEQQLQNTPTPTDILQTHAAASSGFLGEREKKVVANITNKLNLLKAELNKLKDKRKRVSLKEKIMVEIETGRVGSRKNPVPALSKKIATTQVNVQFLKETNELIKTLTSQLQTTKTKAAKTEEQFNKTLREKKMQVLNQGLRLRRYEQEKHRSAPSTPNASMMMSPIAPLSIVLNSLNEQNQIDTPAGTLVLMPHDQSSGVLEDGRGSTRGSALVDGMELMTDGSIDMNGVGVTNVTVTNNAREPSPLNPLEQSLKFVGGLPPMSNALATDAPHLIPPHMLPRGGTNGDPRDNGRPGSNSSKGRRDKWLYDQKGAFKKAVVPEMFQISTGRRDPLTGKIAWKNNGIFNRFDAIELFAGRTRNIYRQ